MFDSPDSTSGNSVPLVYGVLCSYPVILFAFGIVAWILFAKKRYIGALILTSIPFLLVISLVILYKIYF